MRQKKVKALRRAAQRSGGVTVKEWRQTKKFFTPGVKIPDHILRGNEQDAEEKARLVHQAREQKQEDQRTPRQQEARKPGRIILP